MTEKQKPSIEIQDKDRELNADYEKTKGDMASSDPDTRARGERHFEKIKKSEYSNGSPPANDDVAHRRH